MAIEHRTSRCAAHGHPEITLRLAKAVPVPGLERLLIDFFEDGVARGTRFLPGQTVQLGWATLRLLDRPDGTVGVEEADVEAASGWVESCDRALMATWLQQEVARSVGLDDRLAFPRHEQGATVCSMLVGANAWVLARGRGSDDRHSGWLFLCADPEHDHGQEENLQVVPLIVVVARLPFITQFLALPEYASVAVQGPGRIRATVFYMNQALAPTAGSYLAALAQSTPQG